MAYEQLEHLDAESIADTETTTVFTPPQTVVGDHDVESQEKNHPTSPSSSVPWPGSTFIIRSVSSGHLLTLENGRLLLAPAGGRGSIHWNCVETKGWLGFRNTVSGRFLGHDKDGKLRCTADRHQGWENFCVRMRPDGGYVLLMTHFERLWVVGFVGEKGKQELVKMRGNGSEESWEFVKV